MTPTLATSTTGATTQILVGSLFLVVAWNLVSGLIEGFWSHGERANRGVPIEARQPPGPGRLTRLAARTVLLAWRLRRGNAHDLRQHLERMITWLMDGDTNTVQITTEEAQKHRFDDATHITHLIWQIPTAAAVRLSSPVGQVAGALVGAGTLLVVPYHFTNTSLVHDQVVRPGYEASSGTSYILLSLGMMRWAAAARQDPSFGLTIRLRQALTLLTLAIPVVIVTFNYTSPYDATVAVGLAGAWLGGILLLAQAHPVTPDIVRVAGLALISLGSITIALGDAYWIYYSLIHREWIWAASLTLIVAGTTTTSISAALGTQLCRLRPS